MTVLERIQTEEPKLLELLRLLKERFGPLTFRITWTKTDEDN